MDVEGNQRVLVEPTLRERQAQLALELTSLGADTRRLDFLRWLVEHEQNPEWYQPASQ